MVYSRVVDKLKKTVTATRYEYDSFGRRVITQEEGSDTMKTLYDGFTFEIIKESPILANGLFTDKYNTGIQYSSSDNGKQASGRYRYVDDSRQDGRYSNIDDDLYANTAARNTRARAVLYGNGSPVAVNRGNDTAYLGTDRLGSVRTVTSSYGTVESESTYDVFG